jgi:hypothetical protein
MMLYVNGDSHTAGAEAVNTCAFAEDDPRLIYLGRLPHPDNLAVTWGKTLSLALRSSFHCDAESASSNDRIIRTTKKWLAGPGQGHPDQLIVIQWSTWEREEWFYNGIYYQVNGSGIDQVPEEAQDRYRNYVINLDWRAKTQQAHDQIWAFHQELKSQGMPHIFFNGNSDFSAIADQRDWGVSYMAPYDPGQTYHAQLQAAGIDTVMPGSYHYGANGHNWWFRHVLNYMMQNQFV